MIQIQFGNDLIDFPQLTVLIGPNGSGKTRLIKSIGEPWNAMPGQEKRFGKVNSDGELTAFKQTYIQQMSGDSPEGLTRPMKAYDPAARAEKEEQDRASRESRNRLLAAFEKEKATLGRQHLDQFQSAVEPDNGTPLSLSFIEKEPADLASAVSENEITDAVLRSAEDALSHIESRLSHYLMGHGQKKQFYVDRYYRSSGKLLRQSNLSDLVNYQSYGDHSAFAIRFNEWIARWRFELAENLFVKSVDLRAGTERALSDHAFTEAFGEAPWEIINRTLATFGLPYTLAAPDVDPRKDYHPSLIRSDGVPVPIEGLSSGEMVLFKLALSLLQFDEKKLTVTYPDLLLLDEVDASLDPENLQVWLTAIVKTVVEKMDAHVIIATHSPITAALVPEESLYKISDGDPVPRQISQRQAVDQLTEGLPTLSVDYSGQRQVFTESETDAAIMQALLAKMKAELQLPLTLNFIRTGVKHKTGETNAGRVVVRSLVKQMKEAGNRSVRGLVDWDNDPSNVSDEGIYVLGEGTHYTIENILLDPLLVAGLLIYRGKLPGYDLSVASLQSMPSAQLQELADAVCPDFGGDPTATYNAEYFGGMSVTLPEAVRSMNGHELEEMWFQSLPALREFSGKGRGRLGLHIAKFVIGNVPALCPKPLSDGLIALAGDSS